VRGAASPHPSLWLLKSPGVTAASHRLVRRESAAAAAPPPLLDDQQRQVVDHEGGPLLVLAGPGTGKTTTIVEAVVDRIDRREIDPERVLVLTFSRKAAHELRERITGRLRRTTRSPLALTFHSYAYALLRREAVLADEPPPRLLSGPEQLLEVRRLLQGELADGAGQWPAKLRPALATRGFAEELRDFLMRAAERGLGPTDLINLGRLHGRGDWYAIGRFLHRYNARFDIDPVPSYDYAELIHAAAGLLTDERIRERERAAHDVVFVDEYQDTDPAQEHLLRQLAGDGRELVAVGDPDQSIYGFRGADVRGILDFPHRFRTAAGGQAPVVALRTCRRMAPLILAASRRVARRLPAVPGAGRHRDLRPAEPIASHPIASNPIVSGPVASSPVASNRGVAPEKPAPAAAHAAAQRATDPAARGGGEVSVVVADSASQEAAHVADELRRAHLLDRVPWSRMAVLVRSAVLHVPPLRRALAAAGVPVVVAGDEVPMAAEPGVRPLIMLLRCALRPSLLDEQAAEELLTGPLGAADPLTLRRLRRALQDLTAKAGLPRPASPLADALNDPRDLTLVQPRVRAAAERVAGLIATARDQARTGGTAEDVLWAVWRQSGLSERLLADSVAGGARGAAADRDLDGVVALFDHAARFADRLPQAGPELFLDDLASQEIPGDTLAERAPAGEAVRILTAHRAKGLEWDLVVVAGVQEGVWPDLRMRGSLLGIEDMVEAASGSETVGNTAEGAAAVAAKLLEEERRLFYVAVTRARGRLVVTAVGGEDADERPSRFLAELLAEGADGVRRATLDERNRWLSLPALVADLRAAAGDPERPEPLRRAAAGHLARLARAGVRGAHPREWYALTSLSSAEPAFAPDATIRISPSQIDTFVKCGLRWLLERAVGATDGSDTASSLGQVIHAIAELVAGPDRLDEDDVAKRLDEVWEGLDFGSVWFSRKQRATADEMVRRFLRWHRENTRELAGVEEEFHAKIGRVEIVGRIDRIEREPEGGRGVIVDIKTSSSAVPAAQLARHPQLGVYQLAVLLGAFERFGLVEPGGAELVQVGKGAYAGGARVQSQPALPDDGDPEWSGRLVAEVGEGMSGTVFEARANDGCRTCPVRTSCPIHDEGGQLEP
jgi:superfamily I DNA/RNA helicase/RecB family exonuclease